MTKIKVTLIVARTTEQELASYQSHKNPQYVERLAVAYLSKADLEKLGASSGDSLKITSQAGSTIVKAVEDPDLQEGFIVIPKGFWASRLSSPNLSGETLLVDRGVEVTVEKAEGSPQLPSF